MAFDFKVRSKKKRMNVTTNKGKTMDEIKETIPEENCVKIYETDINITSKEDLASFFKNWDHDVNKVYTSDVCIYEK